MRIAVLGAGAIGGMIGLLLQQTGHSVHLLVRGDAAVLRRRGLRLNSAELGRLHSDALSIHDAPQQLPACELVLVTCKAFDNLSLAQHLNAVTAPGGTVVLLQNGLGGDELLRGYLQPDRNLIGGVALISAHRRSAGIIDHAGCNRVELAWHSGPGAPPASGQAGQRLCRILQQAGLQVDMKSSLPDLRWRKLAITMAFSGMTVVHGCTTRQLMRHLPTRTLVRSLMDEVALAARAHGVALSSTWLDQAFAMHDLQADFRSSMQVDHERGRSLELEAIYGYPIRSARARGAVLPQLTRLWQRLQERVGEVEQTP